MSAGVERFAVDWTFSNGSVFDERTKSLALSHGRGEPQVVQERRGDIYRLGYVVDVSTAIDEPGRMEQEGDA